MSIESIKKEMIKEIASKGFPVGTVVGEADGQLGYYIESADKVVPLYDYPEDAKTLHDLSLKALALLIEDGIHPGDEDGYWESIIEEAREHGT
jgi:hypothetical protein